ncbi:MAG: exodeoxyribonuclease VII large subunit [Firmicutes bacterium]|nr:exodeoxyribonuclease VII large subunit [Bacillota bacterium]
MKDDKYLSITAITKYLKYKLDSDEHLKCVFLKGEISNFKAHSTGHFYFSLKDETSKINAIMFSANAKKILFNPKEGDKVLVAGRISVYEATGNYQIYVDEMLEDGVGNLYIAFEKLKNDLAKEGLFDENKKKSIPKIPTKVGIVTAPTGAAIKDIISTIRRRFPLCETILFPALVQGENAASDIVNKIKIANTYDIDVLIVGRGGGSIEDLWPFNEEIVARAIYDSKVPIISAVGHEVDFTIADFVADLRAPTPTGAAELAVPNIVDVKKHIEQLKIRGNENISKKISYNKLLLESFKNSFIIKNPIIIYENKQQKLDLIIEKIKSLISKKLDESKNEFKVLKNHYILNNPHEIYKAEVKNLEFIIDKLNLINPLNTLKRGFTLTYQDNNIIKNIENLKLNDTIITRLNNGIIESKITNIMEVKDGE